MSELKSTVREIFQNAATVVDAVEYRFRDGDMHRVEISETEWHHVLRAFAAHQAINDSLSEKIKEFEE